MLAAPPRTGPLTLLLTLALSALSSSASAGPVAWVDWQSADASSVFGVITVDGSTLAVTYTGERGFVQTACGADYWVAASATNPYTSSVVDNPPDQSTDNALRCDIIALNQATAKLLTFSEPVTNPLFAVVSLNGNGYRFDRDFTILSTAPGYWGSGTLSKQITSYPDGSVTYDVIGTGEPHGVLAFIGTFQSISWNSLTNEYWNGFSIAVEHLAVNVPPEIQVYVGSATISDGQAQVIDFGTVATSSTVRFTIRNIGTGPLNIAGITLTGAGAGRYALGPVVPAIGAGASSSFDLTYTASTSATDTATVTLYSDDADEAEFDFTVAAHALIDDDGDGHIASQDCDDQDPAVYAVLIFYRDNDSDGFGDASDSTALCQLLPPTGFVLDGTDNCPTTPNLNQADTDNDGIGDACDPDQFDAGMLPEDSGVADAGADGGPPPVDSGTPTADSGVTPSNDAGVMPSADAGASAAPDSGTSGIMEEEDQGGCGCNTAAASRSSNLLGFLVLAGVLLGARRRARLR